MALNVPPGYGQFAHHFTIPGDNEEMLVTGGYQAAALDTNPQAIAAALHDAAKTLVNARLPVQVTLQRTTVTLVLTAGGDPVTGEQVDPSTGGRASSFMLPQNSAWLIKKLTAFGGRKNRGRMFFPGVPDVSVNDAGIVNPPELVDWAAALDTYLAVFLDSVFIGGMFILHNSSASGAPGGAPTQVLDLQCDGRIATQRQRLRR
jgi:hypothetical protein